MTMSKFFYELMFGAITTAHYVADNGISGSLSHFSLLIYQIGIIILYRNAVSMKSNFFYPVNGFF